MRCKVVTGWIIRYSWDIAIITNFTHIFTKLRQDGVLGANCRWRIINSGCSPLIHLLSGYPNGRYVVVYEEFVKFKEDPLRSQAQITKPFFICYKLLEERRIDTTIIELIGLMDKKEATNFCIQCYYYLCANQRS